MRRWWILWIISIFMMVKINLVKMWFNLLSRERRVYILLLSLMLRVMILLGLGLLILHSWNLEPIHVRYHISRIKKKLVFWIALSIKWCFGRFWSQFIKLRHLFSNSKVSALIFFSTTSYSVLTFIPIAMTEKKKFIV